MKKITVNYFILRVVSAILLGMVLLLNPNAVNYVVITIGVLFIIPGLLAFVNYLFSAREKRPESVYMFAGLGSLLLGIALVAAPDFFIKILMYILGAVLVVGGIEQFVVLFRARKFTPVAKGFYIIPTLLFIMGVVVLFDPIKTTQTIFMFIGATCLVYGIMEIVYWIKFVRKANAVNDEQEEDDEIVEQQS